MKQITELQHLTGKNIQLIKKEDNSIKIVFDDGDYCIIISAGFSPFISPYPTKLTSEEQLEFGYVDEKEYKKLKNIEKKEINNLKKLMVKYPGVRLGLTD